MARLNEVLGRQDAEAMHPALMARHRLFDLPLPEQQRAGEKPAASVMDQRAGSVIGRMVIHGELSKEQGDAADKYAEDVANYRRAISAPRQPGAVDLNAVRGGGASGAEHIAFVARAIRRYAGEEVDGRRSGGVMGAIRECQNSISNRGMNLFAALDYFILRDEFHGHMVGALREALNALSRHYGFMARMAEKEDAA